MPLVSPLPLGVHLEVNLEVLSSQTILESKQPILGPSDLSDPSTVKKNVSGGWVVLMKTINRVQLRSKSLGFS